jgi:hypothetical protein
MPNSRLRRSGRLLSVALLAAVLTLGCGGGGASKEIQTLQSWRATIDLAAEAQLRGWVTPRYAAQLRDRARDELAATAKSRDKKESAAERDSIAAARHELEMSLARLERTGP